MKKLMLILPLIFLVSCATTSDKIDSPQITTGKSLLAMQTVIVSTREAISLPCQKGMIAQTDCKEMDSIYQQSKPAYDAAVDAAVVALTTGKESDAQLFIVKQNALQSLTINIVNIAAKYGVKGE